MKIFAMCCDISYILEEGHSCHIVLQYVSMRQKHFVDTGKLLVGASIGFSLFWLTSHPKSRFKKKLPERKYKKFSFLPNICYIGEEITYHFHHWFLLSAFYFPLLRSKKVRKSKILHGLFLGAIMQGLLYKDRFQFRYPKEIKNEITTLLQESHLLEK